MLRSTLARTSNAIDLGRVFASLGYAAAAHPFDATATIVARWKTFRVVAADATDPEHRCRALANRLASQAIRGLAVAVGPAGALVLAAPCIGQHGITRLLRLSLADPTPFALEQLERLAPRAGATALAHALRVADVLQAEELGQRFFTAFRVALERMAAALETRGTTAERRLVALLSLTRVLFLYFVQAKGWLDGRSDYLGDLLDRTLARRRHFHRTALHPLFFGTLNRPPAARSRHLGLGSIPYLNGGLFEPHPVERRLGAVQFPNDLWRDTFDELFERFRFCVREGDAADAVAPDMLGRVFERLMNSDERHDSGTFYTPESIVRQIVVATIETALAHELPQEIARRIVAGRSPDGTAAAKARELLRTLRLLDPAVGSGAFLLGALDVLGEIRLALETSPRPDARWRLRKEILRANLFGVDVNPLAVRLAELRLWLAVIADDPSTTIAAVAPLPNLDGVVRQGDTLLDPLGAARRFGAPLDVADESRRVIGSVRASLFDARGRAQRAGRRALRKSESQLARNLLDRALESANHALKDLATSARSRDLFGRHVGFAGAQRAVHEKWKRLRRDVKRAQRKLADGVVPFFSFEVHAPDVLAGGGFTAVVGNPPWIRAEALPAGKRQALKDRFAWWRGDGTNRGYAHQPDVAVAFLERSLELTRPGGAVGLLLPSKVISAGYGETARRRLVRDTSICYVHRVAPADAARFGATTYPLALVVRKREPLPRHRVRVGFDRKTRITQAQLDAPGPWLLVSDRAQRALVEFEESGLALGRVAAPVLGVKTGANHVFVGRLIRHDGQAAVVEFAGTQVTLEPKVIRSVIRGRDVGAFALNATRVLLWGHDGSGAPLARLPARAAHYVRRHAATLEQRTDYHAGPLWAVFRTAGAVSRHRVVWPDLAKRPRAVVVSETATPGAIPLNTCYVAPAPDRETALVIAAVMNSIWTAGFAAAAGDEARGGYRRVNARLTARLPVPPTGRLRSDLAQLSADAHGPDPRITPADLDAAVAAALELSQPARRALEALAAD